MNEINKLTGSGLLLALMIIFQSLRLMMPIPPFANTFLIGSLVHACLIICLFRFGVRYSLLLGIIAPIIAFLQGMLPALPLVIPVVAGNAAYLTVSYVLDFKLPRIGAIVIASVCKALILYGLIHLFLQWLLLPAPVAKALLFVMSWPQIITGSLGGIIGLQLLKRFPSK